MIDTHGIKVDLESLESVAAATYDVGPALTQELWIDTDTGEILYTCPMADNWTVWRDPAIILICKTRKHHTSQWIANQIADTIARHRHMATYIGDTLDWPILQP